MSIHQHTSIHNLVCSSYWSAFSHFQIFPELPALPRLQVAAVRTVGLHPEVSWSTALHSEAWSRTDAFPCTTHGQGLGCGAGGTRHTGHWKVVYLLESQIGPIPKMKFDAEEQFWSGSGWYLTRPLRPIFLARKAMAPACSDRKSNLAGRRARRWWWCLWSMWRRSWGDPWVKMDLNQQFHGPMVIYGWYNGVYNAWYAFNVLV